MRAIKILRLDRCTDASMIHRFRREIKILRTVSHPNVITLHEDNLETEKRFPAFIMDLADCSLPEYIQHKAEVNSLVNPDYSRRWRIKDEAGTRKCLYSEGV